MQPASAHISYDEIPYHGVALPHTHPDNLAVIATLFGMRPAPVDRCRVLELGCAEGGNLIPMAYTLPGSQFVGVDLSPRQIAAGAALVAQLGLRNIALHAADIADLGDDLGEFDYIIVYGIYTWVPPTVQRRIMAICRDHLAPHGVAFVSYNTYPGWHLRAPVRDLMRFHSRHFADPQRRTDQARAALGFMVEATAQMRAHGPDLDLYHQVLAQEQKELATKPDFYLAHEHLEDHTGALYFHEFVEQAAAHQLQYLGEARFANMLPTVLPPAVAQQIAQIAPSRIAFEQYSDFVLRRSFRQTLLCRAEVGLDQGGMADRLPDLQLCATADLSRDEDGVLRARARSGALVALRTPLLAAAFAILDAAAPQAIPFHALFDRACAQTATPATAEDRRRLCAALLDCYGVEVTGLRSYTPPFAAQPGAYPQASALARAQIGQGHDITTLLHEPVSLGKLESALLPLLDGSRNLAALADQIRSQLEDPPPDGELHLTIAQALNRLAHLSLLEVAPPG